MAFLCYMVVRGQVILGSWVAEDETPPAEWGHRGSNPGHPDLKSSSWYRKIQVGTSVRRSPRLSYGPLVPFRSAVVSFI